MDKAHEVRNVAISGTRLRLTVDGKEYEIDVRDQSAKLANATPEQRARFVLSPAGYGIRWPELDEDLSIYGLIGVRHQFGLVETP